MVLILVLTTCSGGSGEPLVDGAATSSTTTSTSSIAPLTSTTIAWGVPFVEDGDACLHYQDDEGTPYVLCARDLGFPGIRGAAFSGWYAIAIVDPEVQVMAAYGGRRPEELEIQTIDGVRLVAGGPITALQAVSPDGSVHSVPHDSSELGDDPILLDSGVTAAHGLGVDWSLWYTRAEEACVEFRPRTADETYPLCTDRGAAEHATGGDTGVAQPDARWCDQSTGGVVYGLARIDPGTDVELRMGDETGEIRTAELPDGDTVALGFMPYDFPADERVDFWTTYESRPLRHTIGLPRPGGPIATYPEACPSLTPTTLAGTPTTGVPAPTYRTNP